MTSRIANHKIDERVRNLDSFINYNTTIVGHTTLGGTDGNTYKIRHWRTDILVLDLDTMEIRDFAHWQISQTTSTLVGRILRNLPRKTVENYIARLATDLNRPADAKRLARMARL